jgi:hypothetical protein
MKKIALGLTALLFTLSIQAQNKNVKTEVKTKVTTIKDSQGEKKLVKTEETKEVQAIELKDASSKVLNKDVKETPTQVTKMTKMTDDGVTTMVDVDRSAYYELDGVKYQVATDNKGYTLLNPKGEQRAILRKTSNNNYIYKSKDLMAYGYFDADGNLVLENYDEATDTVTITTYMINK